MSNLQIMSKKIPREITEKNEELILSEFACFSSKTKGRKIVEQKCDIRTEFQRDRDRIIHSNAFRRLKHKTQVFLIPKSEHFRTRLTHTLEVAQIARTISRALCLNEDLTEAIAIGHDIGHTPFGHDGENVLNNLYSEGFRHYEQSLRVVDIIERDGNGLNLTEEVRDGIFNHTKGEAFTLEGQVVQIADKIAYINHDIEDAVRAGVLKNEDLPKFCIKTLGNTKSERITTLVKSIINNSDSEIKFDENAKKAHEELKAFMFKEVYYAQDTNKEKIKAGYVVEYLYHHYVKNPEKMPKLYLNLAKKYSTERGVCDFISGMSDDYAVDIFKELCVPKAWN